MTARQHVSTHWGRLPVAPLAGYSDPNFPARVRDAVKSIEEQLAYIRGTWSGEAEYVTTTDGAALTAASDTNVTLTAGGTAATALLRAASITAAWAGTLSLARGGTAAALTASNGGIVYSEAATLAILAGTGTAGQIIRSGLSSAPSWSASTYPDSVTTGRLLYGSASNVISGLASANNAILATGGTGIPAWGTDLPTAVTIGAAYIYRAGGTDVAVGDGGTGLSVGTSGGILGYTADGTLASSALLTQNALVLGGGAGATPTPMGSLGAIGQVLHGNAAGAPTWAAVNLAADVTGALPIGSGGTGQTAKAAAFDALSPLDAIGQVIYGGVLGTGTKLLPNSTTTRKFLRNVQTAASDSATKSTNNTHTAGTLGISGSPTPGDYNLDIVVTGGPPNPYTFAYRWNGVSGSSYEGWQALYDANPHAINGVLAGTLSINAEFPGSPPTVTATDVVTVAHTDAADAPPAWDTLLSGDLPAGAALTKGDDTNVTLTLGGSPTVALMAAASITAGWTGQLGLTRGGTAASLAANTGGIVWSGAAALAILDGTATAGLALISGATASPSWWVPTAGSVVFVGTGGALAQDNTKLFWDDSTNELGIGTNSPASSLHVYVNSTATAAAARNLGLAQFDATPVSSSAEERRAVFGWVHLLGNQDQTGWNAGVYGLVEQAGTGAASNIRGVYGLSNVTAAGNVTTAVGVRAGVAIAAASTITSAASLYAEAPAASGGGVITTAYGLYIEDVTAGVTNYGIYQAGTAQNYLGGVLTLGTDLAVTEGGTGLSGGTSGGIPYFSSATALASSAALTASALVLGGGPGATPSTPLGLGTVSQVLHGNAGGAPTWASITTVGTITTGVWNAGAVTSTQGAFTGVISHGAARATIGYDGGSQLITYGPNDITNGSLSIVTRRSDGSNGFTALSVAPSGAVTLGYDLAVTEGGTGASTAANARTNLGLGTADLATFLGVGAIGTALPAGHAVSSGRLTACGTASSCVLYLANAVDVISPGIEFYKSRSADFAAPVGMINNHVFGFVGGHGYMATAYSANVAAVRFVATETWTDSSNACRIEFATTASGAWSRTTRAQIESTGQVNILTDTDASSTITGSLRTAGGLGVAKKGYFGDSIYLAATKGIDFGAGDVTLLNNVANTLTFTGASLGYVFNNGNIQAGAGFKGNVVTKDDFTAYTVATTDFMIRADCRLAIPSTLTLPAATNAGMVLWISRFNNGLPAGTLTVAPAGADTIALGGSLTMARGESIVLCADGVSDWAKVA